MKHPNAVKIAWIAVPLAIALTACSAVESADAPLGANASPQSSITFNCDGSTPTAPRAETVVSTMSEAIIFETSRRAGGGTAYCEPVFPVGYVLTPEQAQAVKIRQSLDRPKETDQKSLINLIGTCMVTPQLLDDKDMNNAHGRQMLRAAVMVCPDSPYAAQMTAFANGSRAPSE